MTALAYDLRYAVRALRARPGFAALSPLRQDVSFDRHISWLPRRRDLRCPSCPEALVFNE